MRKRRNTWHRSVRRKKESNVSSRRIFNIMAWTASFLMVLTMLPADSPAVQKMMWLHNAVPTVSLSFDELAAGPDGDKVKDDISIISTDGYTSGIESQNDVNGAGGNENVVLVSSEVKQSDIAVANTAEENKAVAVTSTSNATGSGNIVIYHTHATEAYRPISSTSTHTTNIEGTVREAGANLTNALKAKGFSVVHDGTLHDSPSYNKSYNKSLETAKKLIAGYGDLKMVIDMHRDAASSAGGKAKTVDIGGQKVASFSLVVGTKNANYNQIRGFAEKIMNKANEMYPGFCTGIIERPHKFNGYLSDNFILLELGNDANTIDQVNTSAVYFADVVANALNDN